MYQCAIAIRFTFAFERFECLCFVYANFSAASNILLFVSGETFNVVSLFNTLETVAGETLANLAISLIVGI